MNKQTIRRIDDKTHEDLQTSIQRYFNSRKMILSVIVDIIKTCNTLKPLLKDDIKDLLKAYSFIDIRNELGATKLMENGSFEIENPALAVIGEINSGKSRLINTILRKDVLPFSYEMCTMRIIRLTHMKPKRNIEFYNRSGQFIMKKPLRKTLIPSKYVQLDYDQQNNPDEIMKALVAHIDSSFLKCGIDLIDTPGLNKTELLDQVSMSSLNNILPIVIYVINGNRLITETDILNLYKLKEINPNVSIIYFVTHLDSEDKLPDLQLIEHANYKLDLIFKKLQLHNFIPRNYKHHQKSSLFNGASLKLFMDLYRQSSKAEIEHRSLYSYHFTQFVRFENNLLNSLSYNFNKSILKSCDSIMQFIMEIITKLIDKANNFTNKNKDNLKLIDQIQRKENEIYEKLTLRVKNSRENLINQLNKRLTSNISVILNPIIEIEYPNNLNIPLDGIVTDSKMKYECSKIIMKVMIQGLEDIVIQYVNEEFYEEYEKLIKRFSVCHRNNSSTRTKDLLERSSYSTLLENKAKSIYKVYDYDLNSITSEMFNNPDTMEYVNTVLGSIKQFLSNLKIKNDSNDITDNVKSSDWKLTEAQRILKTIDHHYLGEIVCEHLDSDIRDKHRKFMDELIKEKEFLNNSYLVNEISKSQYSEHAPNLFMLFLKTFSIYSSYKMDNVRRTGIKLGVGGNSNVYKCEFNKEFIAEKCIKLNESCNFKDVSEEVYYSFQLSHYRLLPCIGAIWNEDKEQISIYFELMKTNLYQLLTQTRVTFEMALNYAIQIGEGIEYLHNQGIIHRDLKLSNILIDQDGNAHIADYGFCKSESLIKYSLVGSPIHIAPEIIHQKHYSNKVDIYSFGIMTWYLFEGTGRHPINRVYDEANKMFISKMKNDGTFKDLNKIQTKIYRPEKITKIPDSLWNFLEKCWDLDPLNRPDISEILTTLRNQTNSKRKSSIG